MYLSVKDVPSAARWLETVGLRSIVVRDEAAVLEMRGGTHVVVRPAPAAGGAAPFDLMVEDLEATHAAWTHLGLDVSAIERGCIHSVFVLRDPDGHRVMVNSSHVVGEL